jgi:pilus assembly protein CpaC
VKDKLSAGQAASPSQRAECLRLAAVLAELAGLDNDAKHLRDEAEKDRPPLSVMEVLAHKQAQLDALQSQVAALRRLTHTEQQVRLDVRFVEISRTKMREAGIKLPALNKTGDHATIGVIDSDHELFAVLEDLRAKGIARVLAEPSLLTVSGRPAFFHSGGEFPFLRQMPQETTIEFKSFGTQIDFVPIVVGDGKLHLDVKPRISSVDPTLSVDVGGLKVPGLNVRECDTGIEMASGQSAVVAGIVQNRVESRPNKGSGATVETIEETELLVLARATLVKDSDAAQAVSAAYRSGHYSPVDHPTQATKTK